MKFLFVALIFISYQSIADTSMKPGLWTIDMKIITGGKEIDPNAAMREALANMPESKKKQMTEMMGSMNSTLNTKGESQVCFTEKAIKDPESMSRHDMGKCKSKITTKTAKKIVSTFSCVDGSSGIATWNIESPTAYNSVIDLNHPKTGKSQVKYIGKFVSENCGKIKPH